MFKYKVLYRDDRLSRNVSTLLERWRASALSFLNSVQHKCHCKKLLIRAYQNNFNVRVNLEMCVSGCVGAACRQRTGGTWLLYTIYVLEDSTIYI